MDTKFFVVRIDVGPDDGLQRCFGMFDDRDSAERLRSELQSHMRGNLKIFGGNLLVELPKV